MLFFVRRDIITKQELIDKVNRYNLSIGEVTFKNNKTDGIRNDISTLKKDFDTTTGEEIVAEMENLFSDFEEALNEIDTCIQYQQNQIINVNFTEETEEVWQYG